MGRTVMFDWDPIFLAAGALTGLRVSASMMLGGTLCWAVFVPILQHQGVIAGTGYRDIVQWTLWGGVACMVTSGLLSFALQWRSALRAFGNLGSMFSSRRRPNRQRNGRHRNADLLVHRRASSFRWSPWPGWRKPLSTCPIGRARWPCCLTFFLALVACRVTGETDTTPIGAMGKVTQLIFGVLSPGNMNVNLMSANITAGAAASSADLLTDLKSGYLLGANPRKQFLAQFAGIFAGHGGHRALLSAHGAQRFRARLRAVSRPVGADLEGRGRSAEQGPRDRSSR